jgi:hypothetical protein
MIFKKKDIQNIICPDDITAKTRRINQYIDYYTTKACICRACNPSIIMEIGVRAGYSAWSFLKVCPDSIYIGFDANNGTHGGKGGEKGQYKKWALKLLSGYQVQYEEFDTQFTYDLAPFVKEYWKGAIDTTKAFVDFFHVDGDHTTKGVTHDIMLACKVVKTYGFILIDDVDEIPEVAEGVRQAITKMPSFNCIRFPSLRGELLIQLL